jgi:hypothetical protein
MATHAPVPYELDMFTQLGIVKDIGPMFDSGLAWQPKIGEKPVVHPHEFPVDNAVVNLP